MKSALIMFSLAYAALWLVAIVRALRRHSVAPLGDWLALQALLLGAMAMLIPFYWMVLVSTKTAAEAGHYPPSFVPAPPSGGTWMDWLRLAKTNYRDAWFSPPGGLTFGRYFFVSLISGALTTAGVLITSTLAAFAFARMRFRGRDRLFQLLLATLMIPPQILMIPNYLILERLGWLDRYAALIVPFLASAFAIFLLRQFFMSIPEELWDAARIDGAGRIAFLWRVLVPLSRPALATAGIFTFLGQWNALLWPLIATTRPEMRTLMVGLQGFNEEISSEPNLLMAASTFSMLPILALFFLLQRFFVQSVARTGIKG